MLSERADSAPGRLRHRLTLETAARTPDGAGGVTVAWDAVATVSAEIVPLKAEERDLAEGLADVTRHRILIRKRDDVAPGDRFRLGERIFQIRSVADAKVDGRYLVVIADEEGRP